MTAPWVTADAIELLREGEIAVEGRLVDASNATLFGTVRRNGLQASCVYKPRAGERPLWDFPDGSLAGREAAAYAVSEASGWGVVPPTVLRDGPFGQGMCQLWIDVDDSVELVDVVARGTLGEGWLPVLDALGGGGEPVVLGHADDPRLLRMALLDAVINNADRKGGHVLPERGTSRLLGVDHGVCFHTDPKLRTVLWGWAGRPIPAEELEVLAGLCARLDGDLGGTLADLLAPREVTLTRRRVERLLRSRTFPRPQQGWPAIPWPPF